MKLVTQKFSGELKKRLSEVFGCSKFEPDSCCYCEQVNRFVNELVNLEHNKKICQSEN